MSATALLTDDQIRQLNDIYTGIVKKYTTFSNESVWLDSTPIMSREQAHSAAEFELGDRIDKIMQDYTDRVANINENALLRGMSNSSIVLQQLDRAFERKTWQLARHNGMVDKLAKRIFMENQRLALMVEKEKSMSKSRALRDFATVSRMRLTVPFTAQTQIDEEVYQSYLAWLLQYPADLAYDYANQNGIFLINMGMSRRTQLLNDLNTRKNAI